MAKRKKPRGGYVDGFVLAVPKKRIKEYRRMAQKGGKIWMKHGALQYFECVGDDLYPKYTGIPFPRTVKAKPNQTIFFSFIIYKSRAHRDRVNAKVFKDSLMNDPTYDFNNMPFDMKRMAFGGFKVMVKH